MSVSDEELAKALRPETHSDEIDTETITPRDHIDPELVDDDMLLGDPWTDDDGMVEAVIETADGYLVKAHRPGDDFVAAPETDTADEHDPDWIVDRCGDFSTVL